MCAPMSELAYCAKYLGILQCMHNAVLWVLVWFSMWQSSQCVYILLRGRCENISPSGLCKECKKVTWLCPRLAVIPFFCVKVKPVMPDSRISVFVAYIASNSIHWSRNQALVLWVVISSYGGLFALDWSQGWCQALTDSVLFEWTVLLLKLQVAPG